MTQIEAARTGHHHRRNAVRRPPRGPRPRADPRRGRPRPHGHPRQQGPPDQDASSRWPSASPASARSTPTSATPPSPARSTTSWRSCTPPSISAPTPSWTSPPAATSTPSARPSSTPRPVPIGTVPIYQIIQNVKDLADITPQHDARHGRAPGQAGRRLHDHPRRRAAGVPAADDATASPASSAAAAR